MVTVQIFVSRKINDILPPLLFCAKPRLKPDVGWGVTAPAFINSYLIDLVPTFHLPAPALNWFSSLSPWAQLRYLRVKILHVTQGSPYTIIGMLHITNHTIFGN